jgi:hypothetical protein
MAPSGITRSRAVASVFLSLARAKRFLRTTLEFCVSMTDRSRDCLNSLLTQGYYEVSVYGTDDIAEILYDSTFDSPVKIKNIYDDTEGKRFHVLEVLSIERYGSTQEPLIITGSSELEKKVKRLKILGVPSERLIVVI